MTRLADYVMAFVAAQGVKHVFLVTGGGAMHLNDALSRCPDLEPVCNSHEQASAMGAELYAKATGGLGVALVTSGPGGTNTVTGVAGAWLDSTPCLFLSGQVKRSDRMFHPDGRPLGLRQLGVQEVDIVSIVRPITKYAVTVLDPADIRYHLEKAVAVAQAGRPGPVWLDIPLDVQASHVDPAALRAFDVQALPLPAVPSDLPSTIDRIVDALNSSERPLIFAGNGIRLAHAETEFAKLTAALNAPVAATWSAADLVSREDSLFVGCPGTVASRGANFALQNCDFLLAIGVRLDFAITGYAPEKLAREACRVVVDVDAAELAKLAPHVEIPVAADAQVFLRALLAQLGRIRQRNRSAWNDRCAGWNARYPLITDEHRKREGRVSIYHLAEVLIGETERDDVMVSGSSGSAIEIFLLACPARSGQRILHNAGIGAMGYGIPAAIAACLARGRQRTICVDGDGGFQFNVQELETVARLQLPIKFFVLNNDGYASIRASQTNYFGSPTIGADTATGLTVPDLARIASAYGLPAVVIDHQADLAADVRGVLETPGPIVCDVRVIPDEVRAPRLSSMQKPDGSFVSKPLEDLWPFLDRDEFLSNMIVKPVPE